MGRRSLLFDLLELPEDCELFPDELFVALVFRLLDVDFVALVLLLVAVDFVAEPEEDDDEEVAEVLPWFAFEALLFLVFLLLLELVLLWYVWVGDGKKKLSRPEFRSLRYLLRSITAGVTDRPPLFPLTTVALPLALPLLGPPPLGKN